MIDSTLIHMAERKVAEAYPKGRILNIALGWGADGSLAAIMVAMIEGGYAVWSFTPKEYGGGLFAGKHFVSYESAIAVFDEKRDSYQRSVFED